MKHKIFSIFEKIIKKLYLRLDIFNSIDQSKTKIIIIINLLCPKKDNYLLNLIKNYCLIKSLK